MQIISRQLINLFPLIYLIYSFFPLSAQAAYSLNLKKSPFDERAYRYVRLENGLEAILVSDVKTEKASISFEVGAGSLNDPAECGGLAHLVEHAILLDAPEKKGPGLRQWVAQHQGTQNASTSFEYTRFSFKLDPKGLDGLLEQLSERLNQPGFDEQSLAGEVSVVHEEFQLLRERTIWRYRDTLKAVVSEDHPLRHFHPGSQASLACAPDLHTVAQTFFKNHYRPDNTRFVIMAPLTLDELEADMIQVFQALPIPALVKRQAQPAWYAAGETPRLLEISHSGSPTLDLLFVLPPGGQQEAFTEFLSFLLDHEGSDSLESVLRAQNLALETSVGAGLTLGAQKSFLISMALTRTDQETVNKAVQLVFSALKEARQALARADYYKAFQNNLNMKELSVWKSSQTPDKLLSLWHTHSPEQLLRADYTAEPFDALELVQLGEALEPENLLVIFAHSNLTEVQKSPVFNVGYRVSSVMPEVVKGWQADQAEFAIRLNTQAQSLRSFVISHAENDLKPRLLVDTSEVQTWYAFNQMGKTPGVRLHLSFQADEYANTITRRVYGDLWQEVLKARLSSLHKQARKAEEEPLRIYSHSQGFGFKVDAFQDELPGFFTEILSALRSPVTEQEFEQSRAVLKGRRQAPEHRYAFETLVDELKHLMLQNRWSANEQITALNQINFEQFQTYQASIWRQGSATLFGFGQLPEEQMLVYGRQVDGLLRTEEAGQALELVSSSFGVRALAAGEIISRDIELAGHQNALLYYQQEERDLARSVMLQLLIPLLRQRYFDEIRTRQQLAYGALVVPVNLIGTPGVSLIAQSASATPQELKQATGNFLDGFVKNLSLLDDEGFLRLKESQRRLWETRTLSPQALADYYWDEISHKRFGFNHHQNLLQTLDTVNKENLILYAQQFLASDQSRSVILKGWAAPRQQAYQAPDAAAGDGLAAEAVSPAN